MTSVSEPRHRGLGLWLTITGGIAFAILAPVGLLTMPLAALVLVRRPGTQVRLSTAMLAGGISVWWLAWPGDPPDQAARAAAVIGTGVFAWTWRYTMWSLAHRAISATAAAGLGVSALVPVLGTSWSQIRWWVESRIAVTTQLLLARLAAGAPPGPEGATDPMVLQLEEWIDMAVPLMADFFPATIAIEMLAGFALATALYRRLVATAGETVDGRFRDFRFTEHFGWVPVLALAVLLAPGAPRTIAANMLVVAGVLYALRGAAVAWFGIRLAGEPGFLTTVLIVFSIVFMLPVVLIGAILLGVADTGLDLRRRWVTPRAES
jgi:hypothetical protein